LGRDQGIMLKIGFVYYINYFLKTNIKGDKKISTSNKSLYWKWTYPSQGAHICHKIKKKVL